LRRRLRGGSPDLVFQIEIACGSTGRSHVIDQVGQLRGELPADKIFESLDVAHDGRREHR
jgi:hypothetical protein